jgi:glycosyltransferase involved in cell wall biosynthesis
MASNEEAMLPGCLAMLAWADEIVVLVDDATTDGSAEVARQHVANVSVEPWRGFAAQRDRLAELSTGEWLFYVDADERITQSLVEEIRVAAERSEAAAFAIPTRNVFLGKPMHAGGWWPDRHYRLIRRAAFHGWVGAIHETPAVDGKLAVLQNPIVHLSHRSVRSMLVKTAAWSGVEAQRRAATGKPVRARSLFGAVGNEVYFRLVRQRGWRDGMAGWIEVFFQAFSRFITVASAWELQRSETLDETYRRLDEHLRGGGTLETFK